MLSRVVNAMLSRSSGVRVYLFRRTYSKSASESGWPTKQRSKYSVVTTPLAEKLSDLIAPPLRLEPASIKWGSLKSAGLGRCLRDAILNAIYYSYLTSKIRLRTLRPSRLRDREA